jgi:hypothetical protein|tara:strand:+ start:19 stop:447 length:429 start_codon:yes stop_codon:yes gene_type:complete
MAIATRTLKDTKIATGSGAAGGKVTVLVNMNDNTTADSVVLDASGLAGHANGAMLDITRVWWALVQGTADDNTGWASIEFVGASADTLAINLAGTGHYDGTAGKIENNATNTGATSGDLKLNAYGVSGYVMIELRKDESFTA